MHLFTASLMPALLQGDCEIRNVNTVTLHLSQSQSLVYMCTCIKSSYIRLPIVKFNTKHEGKVLYIQNHDSRFILTAGFRLAHAECIIGIWRWQIVFYYFIPYLFLLWRSMDYGFMPTSTVNTATSLVSTGFHGHT